MWNLAVINSKYIAKLNNGYKRIALISFKGVTLSLSEYTVFKLKTSKEFDKTDLRADTAGLSIKEGKHTSMII